MIKLILGFLFLANIAMATTAALSEDQIPLKIELETLKTKAIIIQKQFSKFFSDE